MTGRPQTKAPEGSLLEFLEFCLDRLAASGEDQLQASFFSHMADGVARGEISAAEAAGALRHWNQFELKHAGEVLCRHLKPTKSWTDEDRRAERNDKAWAEASERGLNPLIPWAVRTLAHQGSGDRNALAAKILSHGCRRRPGLERNFVAYAAERSRPLLELWFRLERLEFGTGCLADVDAFMRFFLKAIGSLLIVYEAARRHEEYRSLRGAELARKLDKDKGLAALIDRPGIAGRDVVALSIGGEGALRVTTAERAPAEKHAA